MVQEGCGKLKIAYLFFRISESENLNQINFLFKKRKEYTLYLITDCINKIICLKVYQEKGRYFDIVF